VARGTPDWGVPDYQLSGVQVDVADTADRLLGFSRLDSRGRVLYLDTFREGVGGWGLLKTGAAAFPVVTVTAQFTGADGATLYFAAGDVLADVSQARRKSWLGYSKRLGLEVSWSFLATMADPAMDIVYRRVGGSVLSVSLRFLSASGVWQIQNNDGWHNVFSMAAPTGGEWFTVPVKIVGDWEAGTYLRLMVGEIETDLSSYSLLLGAGVAEGFSYAAIYANSGGAGLGDLYCDYAILTKDEP